MATLKTDWFEDAIEQVKAASVQPPATKAEAMKYFQERYPKNWNYELSKRLQPFLPLTKSGQPQSIKNIERRHQARKGKGIPGTTATTAAEYRALGAMIGVKPPEYGYHINCVCWVNFSSVCVKRTIDVDVTGEWAAQLASDPTLFKQAMLLIYMEEDNQDRDIDEQQPSVGLCEEGETDEDGERVNDPDVTITANQQEVQSGHSGRARRFSFFG